MQSDMAVKICIDCKRSLALTCFTTDNNASDKVSNACRECHYLNAREVKACDECGASKPIQRFPREDTPGRMFGGTCKTCLDAAGLRRCTGCRKWRPLDCFAYSKLGHLSKRSRCHDCDRDHWRSEYAKQPVKRRKLELSIKAYRKKLEHDPIGCKLYKMYHAAKERAAIANVPFNIDLDYLRSILTPTCPVLGMPFDFTSQLVASEASPSLDKFKPHLGYVRGNVAIISRLANAIKQNATPGQVMAVAKWMERVSNEKSEIRNVVEVPAKRAA